MKKHFTASGFIMNREKTKVLMVFHKKLNVWVIPGGHIEPDEYPAVAAAREVFEETGVHASIINSSSLDFCSEGKESSLATPYMMLNETMPAKGDEPAHIHMDFIFLGYAPETELLQKQEAEVNDVKWMTYDEVMSSDTFQSVKAICSKEMH